MQQIASQNAPSPRVVLPHFVFGGLVLLAAVALIVLHPDILTGHYFSPRLLGLTHLLALGWISMVIFGALYQLVPVVLEVKLYRESLAYAAFLLLALGAVVLAAAFWHFNLGVLMETGAALIAGAVVCFAANIFATARRSAKTGLEQDFILTAVVWFLFTVGAGITLAFNLRYAFLPVPHLELLKLHAHAGLAGWFLQLIIGVSSRILPMFMVSHGMNRKKLEWVYFLVNGGLLAGIVSLYAQWPPGVQGGAAAGVGGVIFYLLFLAEAYRKRSKQQLDTGMRQSALAFVLLLVPVLLLLLFQWGRVLPAQATLAYGVAILLGFVTALIMGQTYKTLPFIVWLHLYRSKVGRGKIPMPRDFYHEPAAVWQIRLFAAGFAGLMAGVFFQHTVVIAAGGALLLAAVVLYNYNILLIVGHRPKKNDGKAFGEGGPA